MRNTIIKMLSLLCLLGMLFALMSACKKDKGGEVQESRDTSEINAGVDSGEQYIYRDHVPNKDYGGKRFNILCSTQMEQFMVDDISPIEQINRQVTERNHMVEDLYGVELNYIRLNGNGSNSAQFAEEIRTAIIGNSNKYDMVIPQSYYGTSLATEGLYYNLSDSRYIQWDEPWYYQALNEQCEIYGQTYFLASAYLMDKLVISNVVFYNVDLGYSYGISEKEIYEKVLAGQWTIDEMMYYMEKVQEKGYYGCVTYLHGIRALLIGSDTPFVTKDSTGELTLSYYNPRLVNVFEKVYDFANGDSQRVYFSGDDEGILKEFEHGKSLFSLSYMMSVPGAVSVGESDVDYVILPMPKYNTEQEKYITDVQRWELISIPRTTDTECACLVLDALSYYTYDRLVPVVYEELLGSRWARDPNAAKVVEMIRQSIYYDFTSVFQTQMSEIYTGKYSLVYLIKNKDNGIADWWKSYGTVFDEYLDALVLQYYETSLKQ